MSAQYIILHTQDVHSLRRADPQRLWDANRPYRIEYTHASLIDFVREDDFREIKESVLDSEFVPIAVGSRLSFRILFTPRIEFLSQLCPFCRGYEVSAKQVV